MPLATDTIRVTRLLHLGQVASTLDIPIETLRTLNPQYKMDIIPATIKSYTLVLPQHYLCQYIASEEEIHRKDSTYLKEYINPANIEKKKLADATPARPRGCRGSYRSPAAPLQNHYGTNHEAEQAEKRQQAAGRPTAQDPDPPIIFVR